MREEMKSMDEYCQSCGKHDKDTPMPVLLDIVRYAGHSFSMCDYCNKIMKDIIWLIEGRK